MTKFFLTIFALFPIHFGIAQNSFQEAFADTGRPFRTDIRIEFTDTLENQGHLPVAILKGKKQGPVFTIVAGVHGFEYPPIMAIQELMDEIKMDSLVGTLIIIPIANPGSFYARTPFMNPQDRVNLNNAFPGKMDGSITQKTAHFITENIIPVSDVFLDVHGGDANEDLIPFVCYYNNENRAAQTQLAKKLSETSGFEYVVSYPYTITDDEPAKYVFKQAVQDGKTALSIECGKLGNVQKEAVRLIKKGVYNMLTEMGMYHRTTAPKPIPRKLNHQTYISADEKGIFYSAYGAGSTVKEGDVVGYATDEFGTILTEYKAPATGIILYKIATPPINEGDTIMCIGASLKK